MSNFEEMIAEIQKWGRDKGINNSKSQLNKILEELGELASEENRFHYGSDEMQDAVGDILVTVFIYADIHGMDVKKCLEMALETIRPRTGKTVNGCFIKD